MLRRHISFPEPGPERNHSFGIKLTEQLAVVPTLATSLLQQNHSPDTVEDEEGAVNQEMAPVTL